jgi:hypothetical protein
VASLSASIGVIMTALACAHFVLSPRYNVYDSVVSASVVAARYASIRNRDDAITASLQVSTSPQTLMASPVTEGSGPWPKVVWLMSFPNR